MESFCCRVDKRITCAAPAPLDVRSRGADLYDTRRMTENPWKDPLAVLTPDERVRQVVATAAQLEAAGERPTQVEIANAIGWSQKWGAIDAYLRAARNGSYGNLLDKKESLLESTGPFTGTERGSAIYRVTDAGRTYAR
jgi:hypothetical protein